MIEMDKKRMDAWAAKLKEDALILTPFLMVAVMRTIVQMLLGTL